MLISLWTKIFLLVLAVYFNLVGIFDKEQTLRSGVQLLIYSSISIVILVFLIFYDHKKFKK